MGFFLFAAGAAVGSFLKVVADRYDPNWFLWDRRIIGGRSHCPACRHRLRWFELIPVMSYLWQCGKCRACGAAIDWRCPAVEITSGLIFVIIPAAVKNPYIPDSRFYFLVSAWIFVFSILLLVSMIDFRLRMIPDEAHVLLLAAGACVIFSAPFGEFTGSFLGPYAALFGARANPWLNHLLGALAAAALFGALILVTRGRAMGAGDLKLAAVLGFLFGWPDILLVSALSFILGSIVGIAAILARKKEMKSSIAFGPFLASGSFAVFLFGLPIMQFYFGLFR